MYYVVAKTTGNIYHSCAWWEQFEELDKPDTCMLATKNIVAVRKIKKYSMFKLYLKQFGHFTTDTWKCPKNPKFVTTFCPK